MNPLRLMFRLGMVGALLALLPACTSFEHRWAAAPKPRRSSPFQGRWVGTWDSTKRPGEGGRLQCVFTPECGCGEYVAAFHAHWKIFASDYTALFQTRRQGDHLVFEGTHQMPAIFGGMYHFRGRVSATNFSTEYHSSYDDGTFTLHRETVAR